MFFCVFSFFEISFIYTISIGQDETWNSKFKFYFQLPSLSYVQTEPIVVQIDRLDLVLEENIDADDIKNSEGYSISLKYQIVWNSMHICNCIIIIVTILNYYFDFSCFLKYTTFYGFWKRQWLRICWQGKFWD